jgi:3D-(3,5/4)-trihydroxycyclohexane-1,2-dione acylhydrolase (decyclizing)
VPVVADAREALAALGEALGGYRAPEQWSALAAERSAAWAREVTRVVSTPGPELPSQAQVIGAINDAAGETGVVVCAAGSAPGDLHKLWRARDPDGKGYHVEYGYSCMGYEIPGGMGVKLAAPEREVFVLVGDGSYLMMPGEMVTAVAERIGIVIVLVDNHGYASIGALSRSVGSAGFGTHYRFTANGSLPVDDAAGAALAQPAGSDVLPIDLAANAESLGARVIRAATIDDLRAALAEASGGARATGPTVVCIETDRYAGVPGYDSWWDVPVAETSTQETVRTARAEYERNVSAQRQFLE